MGDLEYLRKLTEKLPRLEELVETKESVWIDYFVDNGICKGRGLLKTPLIAVQQAYMSKGSKFVPHIHNEIEYLIVYEGKIEVTYKLDKEYSQILGKGDSMRIDPTTNHHVIALEDSWMIGITIPSSGGYPDA